LRLLVWTMIAACGTGQGDVGSTPDTPPTDSSTDTVEHTGPVLSENVLVVLLDDLGIDKVSAYHPDVATVPQPTLDRLSTEGMRFTTAWTQPVCSPTRASLLTGRHARRLGIGDWLENLGAVELAPGVPLLPELIEEAQPERATGAFGKWHLAGEASPNGIDHPNVRGFDHYAGALGNIGPPYTYSTYPMVVNGAQSTREGYLTSDTIDDAVAWLQSTPEPWFAYVATHAVHSPLHVPPDDLHSGDPQTLVELHGAMLEALDIELGRLLDGIPPEQRERTHVVVLGDNGTVQAVVTDPFPSWSCKGTPNEGGVRVPMWVLGPSVQPGTVTDAMVHVTDILPTVAGWTDLPLDTPLDGMDLAPILADPSAEGHELLYADRFGPAGPGPYTEIDWRVVRDRDYKFIVDERSGTEILSRIQGPDLRDEIPVHPDDKTADDLAAEARLRAEMDRLRAELTLEVDLPR